MYTVVVCSNCRNVWIVQDRPNTSQCGRCRKRRKFKILKKYHTTDDKDEAKIARAFFQSRVYNHEEMFDRARERGHLQENMNAFLDESQYLELEGLDSDEVNRAVNKILAPYQQRSEVRIIRDAFSDLDNPELEDFLQYTQEFGVSDQNALRKLEGLVRSGAIDHYGNIQLSDIDDRLGDLQNEPDSKEEGTTETKKPPTGNSQRGIILAAVDEHGGKSVQAIIEHATRKGLDRQMALINLEKLAISGQIDPEIGTQEIINARVSMSEDPSLPEGERQSNGSQLESRSSTRGDTSNSSYREIMKQAFRDKENPTEEDIIDFAVENGMEMKRAREYLQKLRQYGRVVERADNTLRLM